MTGRNWTATAVWVLVAALTGCQQNRPVTAGVEDAETVTVAETELPSNQMVYPWSVVPGGVDSPKAMGEAMAADPVVGAHYAGLQPGSFHPERLAEKKQGYVSYRIKDKIYWTRRMVTLAAGEQVLTDGNTLVRGRCGNLFSETPRGPVAPVEVEPAEKAMEEPVRAAQLVASPEMRAEAPVATEKFENPKGFDESASNGSVLPTPTTEDALPPVWVAGGGIAGPGGGVMGVGGFGGGGGSPSVPGTTAPENAGAGAPVVPEIPMVTQSTAVTIPPPLVLMALTHPPSTPVVLEYPVFTPPDLPYPPVSSPQPPQIWIPPTGAPPITHPPASENPPGGTPPPSGQPPSGQPPSGPPPSGPPPSGPPPSGPPPSGPPPSGPPPSGPPPSGPPPFDPPTSPPPDVAVPEPGAWVLAVLGIGAIAVGSMRRKS